jgi:hypothetical protein
MTRQRLRLKADLKLGLSATVSARALIIRLPTEASFDHDGISPQRIICPTRLSSPKVTVSADCVGATL